MVAICLIEHLFLHTCSSRYVFTKRFWMQHSTIRTKVNPLSYHHHHHHHHVMPLARISLTLSRHFSLSFIASGRSSGQHPVSSHSCWMYVRAGRPAFARPCVGVHKSTSLMSSFLLLQQCPACLVRLTWIVFVIGGRWPYSWCLVGCCHQDLFKIARNILVWLPSSFFSSRFVRVHVVHPYSSIDATAAWKKLRFILSVRSDFHRHEVNESIDYMEIRPNFILHSVDIGSKWRRVMTVLSDQK